jgi:hypothetical protein
MVTHFNTQRLVRMDLARDGAAIAPPRASFSKSMTRMCISPMSWRIATAPCCARHRRLVPHRLPERPDGQTRRPRRGLPCPRPARQGDRLPLEAAAAGWRQAKSVLADLVARPCTRVGTRLKALPAICRAPKMPPRSAPRLGAAVRATDGRAAGSAARACPAARRAEPQRPSSASTPCVRRKNPVALRRMLVSFVPDDRRRQRTHAPRHPSARCRRRRSCPRGPWCMVVRTRMPMPGWPRDAGLAGKPLTPGASAGA